MKRRPVMDADERVALATAAVVSLLRVWFGADRMSALAVVDSLIAQYERAAKRDPDTRRRIAEMMRTSPWIESPRDYKRVLRIVDRVSILGEDELLPDEDERLDRLSALIAAYDACLLSK